MHVTRLIRFSMGGSTMIRQMTRRQFSRAGMALMAGAILPAQVRSGNEENCHPVRSVPLKSGDRACLGRKLQPRRLRVAMLDARGTPMAECARKRLYAGDLDHEPEPRRSCGREDGTVEIEVAAPRATLHALVVVPGFGEVWVEADNEGEGYGEARAVLDFAREAARTRLADVERLAQSSRAAFSPDCVAHREAAREFLDQAGRTSGPTSARCNLAALSHALWAGELAAVERARHAIAQRPARRDFLFGCNAYHFTGPSPYADYFPTVMNCATLPFYLREIEPVRGQADYRRVDRLLAWCRERRIRPKGHPLWWGLRPGVPDWLAGATWREARAHCERVVARSVERYRGEIEVWDVINEAHDYANMLRLTQEQEIELTRAGCETARATNPRARTIVNNCAPFPRYAADGEVTPVPADRPVLTPLAYLRRLAEAGVPFDCVGLQIYFPHTDMMAISKMLDRYARLGKPIHVTELGVSSEGGRSEDAGHWHQPWCERVQADWLEWFYTIAYARPEIEAISWWDFRDPAFVPTSGILSEDESPREIYFRLKALKQAWGIA
jgi:GH35 family endo-1,4-beta-xylanase